MSPTICMLADAESVHTRKWAQYFAEKDYEVHLISRRDTRFQYHPHVTLHVLAPVGGKIGIPVLASRVRKLVKHINPTILHSHYATSYGLLGRLCHFHPFFISAWGSDIFEFPRTPIHKALLRYILKGADVLCSTSHAMAQEMLKYNDRPAVITPFGVDTEQFSPKVPILSGPEITIGVTKTLEPIYGIEYLIRAFAMLTKEVPQALKLKVIGDGYLRSSLEQLCQELGVAAQVEFLGRIEHVQLQDYLNQMDIICLPSLQESFGVAAIEACACGRPVVASNVGGLPEIVLDGHNGYLVPPKDPAALKERLKDLIVSPSTMQRMGKAGRELVIEKYQWNKNALLMEQLYEKLAEGN